MAAVLRAVTQRACALFQAEAGVSGPGGQAMSAVMPPPSEQVRHLAVSCNALCSLTSAGESGRGSDFLAVGVVATFQQLVSALAVLPESASIPPEVTSTLFKVAKHATRLVPPRTVYDLLQQLDRRMNPAAFALWGPHQQLQILHTMAKTLSSHAPPPRPTPPLRGDSANSTVGAAPPFAMVADLLHCLGQELGKLSESEAALLLWCLATLQQQSTSLWTAACRRCLFLLRRMNSVSQATILHALLISPHGNPCEAQQELMGALVAASSSPSSLPAAAGNGSWFDEATAEAEAGSLLAAAGGAGARERRVTTRYLPMSWLGDETHAGDSSGHDGDGIYDAVRSRLFGSVHHFSTDMLLSLYPHLNKPSSSAIIIDVDDDDGVGPGDLTGDARFVVTELCKRRNFTEEQAVRALHDIVFPRMAAESARAADRVADVSYAEQQLSGLAMNAIGSLVQLPPPSAARPRDVCLCLATVLLCGCQPAGRNPVLPLLNSEQHAELFDSVVRNTQEVLRRGSHAFGFLDGESLWACAVAGDAIAIVLAGGIPEGAEVTPEETEAVEAKVEAAVKSVPSRWRQHGDRELHEQCAAVMALALHTETPTSVSRACLSPSPGVGRSLAKNLLLSCQSVLNGAERLPLAVIARVLTAIEPVTENCEGQDVPPLPADLVAAFTALARRLVLLLETPHLATSRASLLAEVGSLLSGGGGTTERRRFPQAAHQPTTATPAFRTADALLDLYLRLLQNESPSTTVVAQQNAVVLVRCLERRARAGPDSLERGFMVLCTRRLGQKQSFLKAMQLPPSELVALIHLAHQHLGGTGAAAERQPTPARATSTAAAIIASLLEHILPAGEDTAAVLRCADFAALNDVASLLSLPVCAERGLKEPLARAVTRQAIQLTTQKAVPAVDKAMLVAYFVRANVEPSEELLTALRKH